MGPDHATAAHGSPRGGGGEGEETLGMGHVEELD